MPFIILYCLAINPKIRSKNVMQIKLYIQAIIFLVPCGGIPLPPYLPINYVSMRDDYVNGLLIHVNMQHIYDNVRSTYLC